jgi:signal transduction histidine kinase
VRYFTKKLTASLYLASSQLFNVFLTNDITTPVFMSIAALESELAATESPVERVDILNQLVWELRLSDPMLALQKSMNAEDLARQVQYEKGIVHSLCSAAICNWYLGNYDLAGMQAMQSLEKAKSLGDTFAEAAALNWIANVSFSLGDTQTALTFHTQSLHLKRSVRDRRGESYSLSNLCHVYRELKQYDKALSYALDGLQVRQELGDEQGIAMSLHDVATVYADIDNFDGAEHYFNACLDICKTAGEHYVEAVTEHRLGKLYRQHRLTEKARESFYHALTVSERIQSKEWIYKTHQQLAEIFEAEKNFERALVHQKEFQRVQNEVFGQSAAVRLKSLTMQFDVERARQEAEIARLKNVELAEANKLKTDLMNMAAHDLRNPLQSVLGYAMLLTEKPSGKNVQQYAAVIERAANRMIRLIEELLLRGAKEAASILLKPVKTDAVKLIAESIESLKPLADKKHQVVHFHHSASAPVLADEDKLKEIIENLLSNAIKYSPRNTKIAVSVEMREASDVSNSLLTPHSSLLIAFRDEGQGLTDDDKTKLFGKFQKLSATPTDNEPSTGLGLSIVKHLVELHGGKIWAESEGKNKGTTFFVALPSPTESQDLD